MFGFAKRRAAKAAIEHGSASASAFDTTVAPQRSQRRMPLRSPSR